MDKLNLSTLLKKVSSKKSEKNIILFSSSENNLSNSLITILEFKKLNKIDDWLESSVPIYIIYNGEVYNPPFFNNIISLKKNTLEDLHQIWNMAMYNGFIIINSEYSVLFGESIIMEDNVNKKVLIKKNLKITYQFPKYRILDFIIAGTMKGGTSAAIKNLSQHKDISMVKNEIHFFDNKNNYMKGLQWYKNNFDYSKKMVGDKAPDVMYDPSCLELLQIMNPHVKIILFLRNPIDRAYSHWKMLRDLFRNKLPFEYCIYDEIKNRWGENRNSKAIFRYHIAQRGLYYQQIENILKYFSKDNLLIIISEKIRTNPDEEHQKIFDFLGVEGYHGNFVEHFSSDDKSTLDKKSPIYKNLKKIYNSDVKKLEKFIGYKTEWW